MPQDVLAVEPVFGVFLDETFYEGYCGLGDVGRVLQFFHLNNSITTFIIFFIVYLRLM